MKTPLGQRLTITYAVTWWHLGCLLFPGRLCVLTRWTQLHGPFWTSFNCLYSIQFPLGAVWREGWMGGALVGVTLYSVVSPLFPFQIWCYTCRGWVWGQKHDTSDQSCVLLCKQTGSRNGGFWLADGGGCDNSRLLINPQLIKNFILISSWSRRTLVRAPFVTPWMMLASM